MEDSNKQRLLDFLEQQDIHYERFDHPPVFTVADVHRLTPDLPGVKTKNLFLRDNKGKRHFLVIVPGDKRVDVRHLNDQLGCSRLSFGSADRLMRYLGVEPGAVSLLALFNDTSHGVDVVMDEDLWTAEAFQFHPLVNTSTLVIAKVGIECFLSATGHTYHIKAIPSE